MNTVQILLVIIATLVLFAMIAFSIVWIVGKASENERIRTIGHFGLLACVPVLILVVCSSGANYNTAKAEKIRQAKISDKEEKEEAEREEEMDTEFTDSADKLTDLAKSIKASAALVALLEHDDWKKEIDAPGTFDVDQAILNIVAKNQDLIDGVQKELDEMDTELNNMYENDTGNYDYDAYKDLYNKTEKLVDFVASPHGSYMNFYGNYNDLSDDVEDAYKNVTD